MSSWPENVDLFCRGGFLFAAWLRRFALLRADRFTFAFQVRLSAFAFSTHSMLLTHEALSID